jgi:gluconolactonase
LHADNGLVVGGRNIAFKSFDGGDSKVILDRDPEHGNVGFNDLTTDTAGRIYVGSLGSPVFDEGEQLPGDLHVIEVDGSVRVVAEDVLLTNGLGFSPNEKTLYVANSDAAHKVWMAYGVKDDGTLDEGRVFADATSETAEGLPDGLKLDKQGNLYLTGPGGVWIYNPEGKHLGSIQPEEVPANVAWGDDGKTLYMTARTGLYRIALNAEGTLP